MKLLQLFRRASRPAGSRVRRRGTRLNLECLETRRLLSADPLLGGASVLHNPHNAADVNADGLVSSLDAMLLLQELHAQAPYPFSATAESLSALWSAVPRTAADAAAGAATGGGLYFDVDGDSDVTPLDALMVIRQLNEQAEAKVRIRLETTDLANNPITQIGANHDFLLRAFVQDVRAVPGPRPGVFGAYLDVTFDPAMATVSGAISHSADYPNAPSGNAATPGLLNEVGGFQNGLNPLGTGEVLLFSVRLTATAPGTIQFTADPADNLPVNDTLLFDPASPVPSTEIMYGTTSLVVNPLPTLSVANQSVAEGNAGTTPMTFTVSLSAPTDLAVTVNYATAGGSAGEANDYNAATGTLTFNPGETSKTVTVNVKGETAGEANEQFFLNLSSPANATLAVSQATGTINDDDVGISIADNNGLEGTMAARTVSLTVMLTTASDQTITVPITTLNGTATSGTDFFLSASSLTFAPGQLSNQVLIFLGTDATFEANENFFVNLGTPSSGTILRGQGQFVIENDDAPPALAIDSPTAVVEPGAATVDLVFTVTLTGATDLPATVNFATADGTAAAGFDYETAAGTLTFNPGETSKTITVKVKADTLNEATETFLVNLTTPVGATTATAQGTGTIQDDGDPQPSISIAAAAPTLEGNTGTTPATFTVSLSAASGQTVTVNFATAPGATDPATEGDDYTASVGTLTFLPGETSKTITVDVKGDTANEKHEQFVVNLSGATNATIAADQGAATITDDDNPGISIDNPTAVTEGNLGTKTVTFTVTLSAASQRPVTVDFATVAEMGAGKATEDVDYVKQMGSLTFAPGETSKSIVVTINGDDAGEPTETFKVLLSNLLGATPTDLEGTATITDDDQPVASISGTPVETEGNPASGMDKELTFTVTLSSASSQAVTVNFATENGTATSGADYVAENAGTVTIPAGQLTGTIKVRVVGDTLDEDNETVLVNLTGANGATLGTSQATGTIQDDDESRLSINDRTVVEGNTGTTEIEFTVTLSAPSTKTVTVNFATGGLDDTATAGNDYVVKTGTLTFMPGELSKTFKVVVNGDTDIEPDETFSVALSGAVNAGLDAALGTGTIANDDQTLSITAGSAVNEGAAGAMLSFTVTLSTASTHPVTVQFATANGTATSGADYEAKTGTLTFNPGDPLTQTIFVNVLADALDEADEAVVVNLSAPAGATLATATATGTITDDDPAPTLSIDNASVPEGNTGTNELHFTVKLSAASSKTITVDLATGGGTAAAGVDYMSRMETLTFQPGELEKMVRVFVNSDTAPEPDETVNVTLANAINAGIGVAQGTGTITDDDLPRISIAAGPAVSEGATGATLTFTVTLSRNSTQTVTVQVATADGTATSGADYEPKMQTLTFASGGPLTQTFTVKVLPDALNEANETVVVNLSAPDGANLGTATATGTINDDDPALPTLSISTPTPVTEGNTGTQVLKYTVTLSAASGKTVTVNFATGAAGSTATAGVDYVNQSGTLTFAPGETSKTIDVVVNGDTASEPDETVVVALTTPINATLGTATATGTIADDDPIGISITPAVSIGELDSGTRTVSFIVTLTRKPGQTITVDFATAAGTATAGSDFVSKSGTLTFGPNDTTRSITIDVNGDVVQEASETFFVNLTNPTGGAVLLTAQGTATINDDDPKISISGPAPTAEGDTGTKDLVFTVTLSAAAANPVTVKFDTAGGSATQGSDFEANSGTLTFAPGETTKTIIVKLKGDTTVENDEEFQVTLSEAMGAAISPSAGSATAKILNDDAPTISITTSLTGDEGNAAKQSLNFSLTLSQPYTVPVSVRFTTRDGTARSGIDYDGGSAVITFAPGVTTHTIAVTLIPNALDQDDRQFFVDLSDAIGAAIETGKDTGTGTIRDDDLEPTVTINSPSVLEGNSGTRELVFTVTLSAASGKTVTVPYNTVDGTALDGEDYVATSGDPKVIFEPGETTKTLGIVIVGDNTPEPNETFLVQLGPPTGATRGMPQTGTGTILDDEPVRISIADPAAITEPDTGTRNLVFTVTLSRSVTAPVTVDFATASGTATSGSDFVAQTGKLTFNPGEITKTITVAVNGDLDQEPNETFTVNLSNASANATILTGQGTGTINNNDPKIMIADPAPITEGDAGTKDLLFTVTLSGPATSPVTVKFATSGGTTGGAATENDDYQGATGTLTFNPGETSKQIAVKINGDTTLEGNEQFRVTLSDPTGAAIERAVATGTIQNDEVPAISINDPNAHTEGGTGRRPLNFTLSLSQPYTVPVSVRFATRDGTAKSGVDYDGGSAVITFAPGVTTHTIAVTVPGNTQDQPNREFFIDLSDPVGATIDPANNMGTGTINDDDPTPPVFIPNASITEGDNGTKALTFTVQLLTASGQEVTVDYATADVTAKAGEDYQATSGKLTFAAGETSKTITVNVIGDTLEEANETFNLTFSNAVNTSFSNGGATINVVGTITNDDALGSFSGFVYIDANNDGAKQGTEKGIGGVTIMLTGTDGAGMAVSRALVTAADGSYNFQKLRQGRYTITEVQHPDYVDGRDTGNVGVTAGADMFTVEFASGQNSTSNNFGERGLRAGLISRVPYMGSNQK